VTDDKEMVQKVLI